MSNEPRELLARGLERLGYDADGRLDRLVRYLAEIELWNPRLKLVAAEGRELAVRHLLDSIAGARAVFDEHGEPERLADIGSGAGLPGIPIAIMYPETRVDLVERSGRRVGFLRNAIAAVRASNATVVHAGLAEYDGPADLIVFRAFLPLDDRLLDELWRTVASGGRICAYKGRREAIEAELRRLSCGGPEGARGTGEQGAVAARVIPVSVPFLDEERHLVVFERTRSTRA